MFVDFSAVSECTYISSPYISGCLFVKAHDCGLWQHTTRKKYSSERLSFYLLSLTDEARRGEERLNLNTTFDFSVVHQVCVLQPFLISENKLGLSCRYDVRVVAYTPDRGSDLLYWCDSVENVSKKKLLE